MAAETKHLASTLADHTHDMTGRVAAVTGTTSGTGYVCARELARRGAEVILLNRPSERSTSALARLQGEVPDGAFVAIACDLQDFASVRAAAEAIKGRWSKLDVLCNNAGVMALRDVATRDGYDVQIQTNCISPFLLTKELFGLLRASDDARVVNHTSQARLGEPLEEKYFEKRGGDLGGDGTPEDAAAMGGPRWERYHQTKLANCAFTYGLRDRLATAGVDNVKPILAHPGLALTQLAQTTDADGGMDASSPIMSQAQSAEDGALGIIRGCMDPTAQAGDFFGPGPAPEWMGGPAVRLEPEALLTDAENIRINWEGCEAAVGAFEIA